MGMATYSEVFGSHPGIRRFLMGFLLRLHGCHQGSHIGVFNVDLKPGENKVTLKGANGFENL